MKSWRFSCQILMKIEFSQQIFEKPSSIKFHENSSIGSRVVSCGRTDGRSDRYDETKTHFRNISIGPKNGKLSTYWAPIIFSWLSAHKPSSCIDSCNAVTLTLLRAGCLRNRSSIRGRGKRFFSSSKRPERFWGPPNFLFSTPGALDPGDKRQELETELLPVKWRYYKWIDLHLDSLMTKTNTIFLLFNETNRRTNIPNLFLSRNSTCFG